MRKNSGKKSLQSVISRIDNYNKMSEEDFLEVEIDYDTIVYQYVAAQDLVKQGWIELEEKVEKIKLFLDEVIEMGAVKQWFISNLEQNKRAHMLNGNGDNNASGSNHSRDTSDTYVSVNSSGSGNRIKKLKLVEEKQMKDELEQLVNSEAKEMVEFYTEIFRDIKSGKLSAMKIVRESIPMVRKMLKNIKTGKGKGMGFVFFCLLLMLQYQYDQVVGSVILPPFHFWYEVKSIILLEVALSVLYHMINRENLKTRKTKSYKRLYEVLTEIAVIHYYYLYLVVQAWNGVKEIKKVFIEYAVRCIQKVKVTKNSDKMETDIKEKCYKDVYENAMESKFVPIKTPIQWLMREIKDNEYSEYELEFITKWLIAPCFINGNYIVMVALLVFYSRIPTHKQRLWAVNMTIAYIF